MSMSNDTLGYTFTAAQQRDEALDQLNNEYKADSAEDAVNSSASHAADKSANF
jgi:hypothetical protein